MVDLHKQTEMESGTYIKHRKVDYWEDGLQGFFDEKEANKTIEEIITLLISKEITVGCAVAILEDTISAIQKEALLEKRKVGNKII